MMIVWVRTDEEAMMLGASRRRTGEELEGGEGRRVRKGCCGNQRESN
jgi:hypothetical protein